MVTLIGFFFILGNVGLLVLFVPDLIGPVSPHRPLKRRQPCASARPADFPEGDKSHG